MSSLTSSVKKHLFVINPHSFLKPGDISRVIAEISSCFQDFQGKLKMSSSSGVMDLPEFYSPDSPYAIHISRFPRDGIIIIRKYIAIVGKETLVRVYAIGGDGIAFCCLNGIVGLPNVELAIVPYGTGCDFAMSFGGKEIIPEMRNIKAQIQAPVIPTDIIDCGNIYALNSCAVGLEAIALRWSYPVMKSFWKLRRRFPMVTSAILRISGVVEIFNRDIVEQHFWIELDNEKIEGIMSLIHIANGPGYPINLSVIPDAVPDDGLLDLLFYQPTSLGKGMRHMGPYLKGQYRKFPEIFIYRRVRNVSISSVRPFGLSLDGEIFFDTSFTIKILPKAVKIVSVGGRPFKARSLEYADKFCG
jgi:diacylglycerol kinase family enzyme